MSLPVKSQQDLYSLFISVIQDFAPQLTDTNIGSIIDTMAGVFSVSGTEMSRLTTDQFMKCFIATANGPEVTGGPDDLQTLALDRYGSTFGRPAASYMTDTVTFSRANTSKGVCTITSGSIVKTVTDSLGNVYQYATNSTVVLTVGGANDLSVSVGVTATIIGSSSNAKAGTITVIGTSLSDSTVTVTNAGSANGTNAADDATYRQYIYNLIVSLRGANKDAIEAAALSVAGVAFAKAIEVEQVVIPFDTATNLPVVGASAFAIPWAKLYACDANGTASSGLIASIVAAIAAVRAFGVNIPVLAASTSALSWTAHITLNPSGPNYSTLSISTAIIVQSMIDYVNALGIGAGFTVATANSAMLAIWGPAGSNDITAFTTSVPSGDVAAVATVKLIPGTIQTA